MAEAQQDPIIVYESTRCYMIIPYLSCYHNCPAVEVDQEEEGFQEDLLVEWYTEMKKRQKEDPRSVQIVEAPDPEVFELVPDQPGQPQGTIRADNDEQTYHLRREGEDIDGLTGILRVMKIGDGEYRRESEILQEEQELAEEWRANHPE